MSQTLFDRIVAREIPAYIIWEDENYCAFLTPFANTPGVTVVIPKNNPGEYIFNLEDTEIADLMTATKKVAKLLEKALHVNRVAMVFEGEAIPHVHAKLYPMHQLEAKPEDIPTIFYETYPGFITTQEGPKMDDQELLAIQQKITEAA